MKIAQIEQNVKQVLLGLDEDAFLYDLLGAYGTAKPSIARLMATGTSSYNLSKQPGVVLWKNKVCYVRAQLGDAAQCVDAFARDAAVGKHKPRFVLSTDFERLVAVDTKLGERLDIALVELPRRVDFFLPWAGMEKLVETPDNPANVRAAERMGRLYDIILAENPVQTEEDKHSLNVFLSRLLFCYFAEDTEIFAKKLFCDSVAKHTSHDGSDLSEYLGDLFDALNTEERGATAGYFRDFPYVNGGLFSQSHPIPSFSRRSRELLISCGAELNWSEINPDIFGSMIQAVADVEERGSLGMHYTAVATIRKVIDPLFMSDLREELNSAAGSERRLRDILGRIARIRIFDPACGSGNFLIIAYKELRRLEMEVMSSLQALTKQESFGHSSLRLSQFYGIEIDDFAHEVAILSLWLAEHQMNREFLARFGRVAPPLPLRPSGNIARGNAALTDWADVCPPDTAIPTFIIGNPPFVGARNQSEQQKIDLCEVFEGDPEYKDSDYVSAWILKAARYVAGTSAKFAFVSTNSVCQGEQPAYIWPRVFDLGLEIGFAHRSFKWSNLAKKNAAVYCVVVSVRQRSRQPKYLFDGETRIEVSNVSPYLIEGSDVCVRRLDEAASPELPKMRFGSQARGKELIMRPAERDAIVAAFPESEELFKPLTGTEEFIYNEMRWCLWIDDSQLDLAMSIPPVRDRIEAVRAFRAGSKAKTTNQYALTPHKFAQRCYEDRPAILVPSTTTQTREHLPVGYLEPGVVITNSAYAVYDASVYVFGLISSRMHSAWTKTIGGAMKVDPRYTVEICYNPFPLPTVNSVQRRTIETAALLILDRREQHPHMTIEELYNPKTMPIDLLEAHRALDAAVDRLYRPRPFFGDDARVSFLLAMYERSMEAEHA